MTHQSACRSGLEAHYVTNPNPHGKRCKNFDQPLLEYERLVKRAGREGLPLFYPAFGHMTQCAASPELHAVWYRAKVFGWAVSHSSGFAVITVLACVSTLSAVSQQSHADCFFSVPSYIWQFHALPRRKSQVGSLKRWETCRLRVLYSLIIVSY